MALDGVALATLDDDPGVRPDAHAFIVDKALWFIGHRPSAPIPGAYPRPVGAAAFVVSAIVRTKKPDVLQPLGLAGDSRRNQVNAGVGLTVSPQSAIE